MSEQIQYRRLRAPTEHGQCLIDPPLNQVSETLANNLKLFATQDFDLQGQPLTALAQNARKELITSALQYTASYSDVRLSTDQSKPLILSGHQPTLFHPGVWVKNFGLSQFATENDALAINLIIDNDLVKADSIQVPSGSLENPITEEIVMDKCEAKIPCELHNIADQDLFNSFGKRVAQAIKPLIENPLVEQFWPLAIERSKQEKNLGLVLAQARHLYEQQLGLQTLELPLSTVCQSRSFQWFTIYVLTNLPRFRNIYNQCADEYRQVHRIKNLAQPVPNLSSDDDWLEAPFWIIGEDRKRRTMFVRQIGDELTISDHHQTEFSLPYLSTGSIEKAVEIFYEKTEQKFRIRPRALITTLYARMLLSDLFIHGIGGAKYDQLTDLIMHRFFGLIAPRFITLTATAHLPIQKESKPPQSLEEIANHLRELEFRPERQLAHTIQTDNNQQIIEEILAEKSRLIEQPQSREKHLKMKQINQKLQPFLENRRNQLLQDHIEIQSQLKSKQLLFSREYAFCLFPEKTLSNMLLEIVGHKPYIYKS